MAGRKSGRVLFGDAVVVAIGFGLLGTAGISLSGTGWGGILSWVRHWGLAVALGILGVACLLDGLGRIRRPPSQSTGRPPVRPIRAWAITAMIFAVAAATWVGVSWLLSVANPNDPQSRVEAIRTGLAIGAGVGAAIALLLSARRQWLGERAQAHSEDDATERRVTELYTKAADQLGADKDPVVRLAALYSLERLAQGNPEHRQTIVNVICAYLRMPFAPPPDLAPHPSRGLGLRPHRPAQSRMTEAPEPLATLATRQQELQVRLTAQRILADHLRPQPDRKGRPTNKKFWPDIDLDLTGATLIHADFTGCDIRTGNFTSARFRGRSRFGEVRFAGDAEFGRARFGGDAEFGKARFGGVAEFGRAEFSGSADFGRVRFGGDAGFGEARFDGAAEFRAAEFGDAEFGGAEFGGDADFELVRFSQDAWFEGVRFGGRAVFGGLSWSREPHFGARAVFGEVRFDGTVEFFEAGFAGLAWFTGARFGGAAYFVLARFGARAVFNEVQFHGEAVFEDADLRGRAQFDGARILVDEKGEAAGVWPPGWAVGQPAPKVEDGLSVSKGEWWFLMPTEEDHDLVAGTATPES